MTAQLDTLYPTHLAEIRRRSDAALAATGFDALVVFSGRPRYQFLDDRPYPFRVNPQFKLWAPVTDAPDSFLAHVPGETPQLCFVQPADYWHQPPAVPQGAWTQSWRIDVIPDAASATGRLPIKGRRTAFIGEWQDEFEDWGYAAVNPPALLNHLHYDRAVKTAYEIECMKQASDLGARAHVAAREAFFAGASEFEIHQAYCSAAGLREEELPYGNIIALNEAAAVLHYQNLDRGHGGPRRSFLIDAGAEFRGYASDITRTYAGTDPDFQALMAGMEELQLQLCAAIQSGTDYRDVHLMAHRLIASQLREADLVRCSVDEALDDAVTSVFFPHGIGHLLGLQVHDVAGLAADRSGAEIPRPPGHPYLRLTRRLEPGFVVTVEPGLYFIELLLEQARGGPAGRHINWSAVEKLKPYGGIRIEDDVHCTTGTPENLTREAFARLSPSAA